MRRSNGFRHPVSQVRAFLLGFLVVLVATVTSAQEYIPNGTPVPQGIRYVNTTATGVNTSATFSSLFNGVQRSHTVPVPVSSGTLGTLTKGALKRVAGPIGWYTLFRDLVNGAGWVINELQQQVETPSQPAEPLGDIVYCSTTGAVAGTGSNRQYCVSSPDQIVQAFNRVMGQFGYEVISMEAAAGGNYRVWIRRKSDGVSFGSVLFGRTVIASWTPAQRDAVNENYHVVGQPVTETQLGDLVKAHPEIINAVMIDPQTGAPIRFPELVTAMNDLRKALEAAHGVTPGQDVVTNPNYPNNPQAHEGDRPPFCEWASKVCDFIDWFKKDPDNGQDPDLPYEAREPEMEDYDSGWGGGSCPAPYSVAVLDGEFEISFAGICGFVEYLRPLAIALAWISSAFIVVGSSPRRL